MSLTPKQISALTEKTALANTDLLVIGDMSDSGSAKKIVVSTLKGYVSSISASYSVTILSGSSNWTYNSTAGWYTQTVACSGILSTDVTNVVVDVSGATTATAATTILTEWDKVFRIAVANNTLTIYATAATTTAIPLTIGAVTAGTSASGQSF